MNKKDSLKEIDRVIRKFRRKKQIKIGYVKIGGKKDGI